jgi:hypothetical protein
MTLELSWLLRWSFAANLALALWLMLGACALFAWLLNRLEPHSRTGSVVSRPAPPHTTHRPLTALSAVEGVRSRALPSRQP